MKTPSRARHRIAAMVRKEFIQISRDKRSLGILIFLPVFMLIMFGYALTFDVSESPLSVVDEDRSPESRQLIDALYQTDFFGPGPDVSDSRQAEWLLDSRKATTVLIIPSGFSANLLARRQAPVQVLIDGSNSNEATLIKTYIEQIIGSVNQSIRQDFLDSRGMRLDLPLDVRARIWYNPELKSSVYLVPGLVVYILMITAVISTAVSVVRERERRTLEQLMISPLRPLELIIGKTLPYLLISIVAAYAILTFGYILFGATVKGSHLELFFVLILFLIGGLALGLVVSTVAPNQQVAFLAATFISVLPTLLLSGFMFPLESMHPVLQGISMIFPARYFLESLRFIVIKGADITAYWHDVLALFIFLLVMVNVARIKLNSIFR